jgi:hypothetical protein
LLEQRENKSGEINSEEKSARLRNKLSSLIKQERGVKASQFERDKNHLTYFLNTACIYK